MIFLAAGASLLLTGRALSKDLTLLSADEPGVQRIFFKEVHNDDVEKNDWAYFSQATNNVIGNTLDPSLNHICLLFDKIHCVSEH